MSVTKAYQWPPVDCTAATLPIVVSDAVLICNESDDGAIEPTQVNWTVLNNGTVRNGFAIKLPLWSCEVRHWREPFYDV